MNPGIVALTTDFGRDSVYVAEMKGVLLSSAPGVLTSGKRWTVPRGGCTRSALMSILTAWMPLSSLPHLNSSLRRGKLQFLALQFDDRLL